MTYILSFDPYEKVNRYYHFYYPEMRTRELGLRNLNQNWTLPWNLKKNDTITPKYSDLIDLE